jgi:hypothetical protein
MKVTKPAWTTQTPVTDDYGNRFSSDSHVICGHLLGAYAEVGVEDALERFVEAAKVPEGARFADGQRALAERQKRVCQFVDLSGPGAFQLCIETTSVLKAHVPMKSALIAPSPRSAEMSYGLLMWLMRNRGLRVESWVKVICPSSGEDVVLDPDNNPEHGKLCCDSDMISDATCTKCYFNDQDDAQTRIRPGVTLFICDHCNAGVCSECFPEVADMHDENSDCVIACKTCSSWAAPLEKTLVDVVWKKRTVWSVTMPEYEAITRIAMKYARPGVWAS